MFERSKFTYNFETIPTSCIPSVIDDTGLLLNAISYIEEKSGNDDIRFLLFNSI